MSKVSYNKAYVKVKFVSFSAKVDLLLKYIVELKEDVKSNNEQVIQNLKNETFEGIAPRSFKSLESFEDIDDFEALLNNDDEFAKAVCRFFFSIYTYLF